MLIADTDKGICSIQFSDSDEQLQQGLMREFPFATRRRDDAAMTEWRANLTTPPQGPDANPSLPPGKRAPPFPRPAAEPPQTIPPPQPPPPPPPPTTPASPTHPPHP